MVDDEFQQQITDELGSYTKNTRVTLTMTLEKVRAAKNL